MTEEQKEDIKLLKELIADTSTPNDDREIYQEALNQILAQTKSDIPKAEETKSDMPKVAKEKMPKKEKATPKTKPSKKPKAEKTTPLPSDVDAMKKAIKERTGKTEAECEDIIAQYRKLRAKAKVNNAKRTEKLKSNDDLITGTNVITPVAQIEKDAEIVKAKIEKQVEQIENKAEREVVNKDKTKDEVKVEVEQKVVKQLAKLSDEMVSSATTFVKNIQTELKKVDKTEAKNFLLGLRNEIDALLSKFGDGGSTIETYNITENESASSVNPSLFARGGGIYSSDELYILKVYDLNDNLVDSSKRIFAKNLTKAKEIAIDDYESDMHKKYGRDLRFKIELAPSMMAKGGGVDNKWKYLFFVQGSYGQGFEDLTAHENREDAKAEMRVYDENENYPHRVILRKVLTSDYEKGKYARGGGVGNPSRKKMLDYLNTFFEIYSVLRTIAIEEDNILTRKMLNSLDNQQLKIAYNDALDYDYKTFDEKGIMADGYIILRTFNGIGMSKDKTYNVIKDDRDSDGKPYYTLMEKETGKVFAQGDSFEEINHYANLFSGKNIDYARGGVSGKDNRAKKVADGGEAGVSEWAVTITNEDGDTFDWLGYAKSEDEALYIAEK